MELLELFADEDVKETPEVLEEIEVKKQMMREDLPHILAYEKEQAIKKEKEIKEKEEADKFKKEKTQEEINAELWPQFNVEKIREDPKDKI